MNFFRFLFAAVLASALLLVPGTVSAKSYSVESWKNKIDIQTNADFKVAETYVYAFSGQYNFVYRTIPKNRFDSLADVEVWEGGTKYVFAGESELNKDLASSWGKYISYFQDGNYTIKWYFNALDTAKTFTLKYTVKGGIGFFTDHDELYWNVISNDRETGIGLVETTVTLPENSFTKDKLQIRLLTNDGNNLKSAIIDSRTFTFSGTDLGANSNFTVVCGWPMGLIQGPTLAEREAAAKQKAEEDRLAAVWLAIGVVVNLLLPVITLVVMFSIWFKKGRDEGAKRSIAPEFAPPTKGFLPAQVETLVKEQSSVTAIIATIVDLARQGYLKIFEEQTKILFFKNTDYRLERLSKKDSGLAGFEKDVLESVFGAKQSVKIADLRNKFYKDIPGIVSAIDESVYAKYKLFANESPKKVRKKYYLWGALVVGIGVLSFMLTWGSVIACGFIIMGFGRYMGKRTLEGRVERDKWLGFKLYLAKTDRFGYSENVTQEVFEEYLPFAIIFGVQDAWAKRFADLKFEQPDWYSGSTPYFSAYLFTSNLNSMLTTTTQSISTSPSSSSGFGGGGSAGGGGGGGGSGAG